MLYQLGPLSRTKLREVLGWVSLKTDLKRGGNSQVVGNFPWATIRSMIWGQHFLGAYIVGGSVSVGRWQNVMLGT